MSQRSACRGNLLCLLAVVVALPASAQITFSPSFAGVAVGEVSPPITAYVTFTATGALPGGVQTLSFGGNGFLPPGVTTIPSPVTFTTAPGQTTASVTFRLAAAPWAYPGAGELPATTSPTFAYGLLGYSIAPVSVYPTSATVVSGGTTGALTATISYGYSYPSGPQQLVFSGLPPGASPVPSPVTFGVSYTNDVAWASVGFRISAGRTPPGRYVVGVGADLGAIGAFGSGSVRPLAVATDSFVLIVTEGGSLAVSLEKAAVDVCPGGPPASNTVVVDGLGSYTGSPIVTFPGLPSDLRVSPTSIRLDAVPPAQKATFEISAVAGAIPGARVVTVLANDPYGPSGSATFVVNVGTTDFTPALAPKGVVIAAGGPPATVSAGIAPGACVAPERIRVRPTGLPAGVTATPASAELVAPDFVPVVFSLAASSSAPAAVAEASFVYEPTVGAARTAPLSVTVERNGRIGVSVERPLVDACPGGAGGTNSLTITTLDGYSGKPTVRFPGLPAGLSVTPSVIEVPEVPPSQVVVFTVNAAPGTPAGPATVKAVVSDPQGATTEASFVVNVLPGEFTPAVAPGGVSLNAGGAPAALGVSLVPGACAPSSDVVVTPSGLPPGVTAAPASVVLAAPAFAAAAFSFQASSSAAPGSTTVEFTFAPVAGGTSKSATATLSICGPPPAPLSPVVRPKGNPQGPVTATDFLSLSWGAPGSDFPPTRYEWRLNGGAWSGVTATAAEAPPHGTVDPVQLFVRGYACDPAKGPGPEAASPVYSLAAPVASFSFPTPVVAGRPVTFTDTSSPQATSWLWFPGDGMGSTTVQSPTVTFGAVGPRVVVLVATNGSGSSTKTVTVTVQAPSSAAAPPAVALRAMERESDGRLALGRVDVEPGTTLLLRRLSGEGDAVAYLRLLGGDGQVVLERRLVVADGEEARHDLSAWGVTGTFRAEVVGPEGLEAVVEERAIPFGGPEVPVKSGTTGNAAIR